MRDIQAASRNLSQKQLKWFRDKEPLFCWLDAARPVADIVAAILNELKDEQHKGMSIAARLCGIGVLRQGFEHQAACREPW